MSEVVWAIFTAIAVNSAAKASYATVIAGRTFGRFAALIFGVPLLIGAGLYAITL